MVVVVVVENGVRNMEEDDEVLEIYYFTLPL